MVVEFVGDMVEVWNAPNMLVGHLIGVLTLLHTLLHVLLVASVAVVLLLIDDLMASILESLIWFKHISIVLITLHGR